MEGEIEMGSMGKTLIQGVEISEVIGLLDSLYAYEMVATHYSLAVLNRLEGQASIALEAAFEEQVKQSFEHARTIADRLVRLGGAVTGDPTPLVGILRAKSSRFRGAIRISGKSCLTPWHGCAQAFGRMGRR